MPTGNVHCVLEAPELQIHYHTHIGCLNSVCCRAFHYRNTAVTLPKSPPPVHSHMVSDQNWRWGRCGNRHFIPHLWLSSLGTSRCVRGTATCVPGKWFSPLSKLEVVETDYQHDIWDYTVAGGQRSRITRAP